MCNSRSADLFGVSSFPSNNAPMMNINSGTAILQIKKYVSEQSQVGLGVRDKKIPLLVWFTITKNAAAIRRNSI